jgi:hypothetical protein
MPDESMAHNSRTTTLEFQEEKDPVTYDENLDRGNGNLLYLEDVCYDPIDRLIGLLEEHPSSEEIKCLLLSILSQRKSEALQTSLLGSDTSRHAEYTKYDTGRSRSNKLVRKTAVGRRFVAPPGTQIIRQRSAPQRSHSEHRMYRSSGTGFRTAHQPLPQTTFSNQRLMDTSMKVGRQERVNLTRRETSPIPSTRTAVSQDNTMESEEPVGSSQVCESTSTCKDGTSSGSKTSLSSGSKRLIRSSSAELKRFNSFNVRQRRSRSIERHLVSKSLNLAIQSKSVGLSLSAHRTPPESRSFIDTNQRLSLSLHQNSGTRRTNPNGNVLPIIHGTNARCSLGRSFPGAAHGHPPFEGAHSKIDQPSRKSDGRDSSSHNKQSIDTCIQFHPDGIQKIDVGKTSVCFGSQPDETNIIWKRPDGNSINSSDTKVESREEKGFYGFLKRQLSKEKIIGKHTQSTDDENESDIESFCGEVSFSSFEPLLPSER